MKAVLLRSLDPSRREAEHGLTLAQGGMLYTDPQGNEFAVFPDDTTARISVSAQCLQIENIPPQWRDISLR